VFTLPALKINWGCSYNVPLRHC